jgi:hypothetical protein
VPFSVLADVMMFVGDVPGSRPLWREARRRAEYPIDLAYGWVGEAMAAAYGDDPAAAPPAADEAIRVAEVSGSPIAIAWSCYAAGEIRLDDQPDEALGFLERALDAAAAVGERMAFGAAQLSALSLRCREHVEDRDVAAYHELIQHWLRLGAWLPLWTTVRNLAELLVRRGDDRHAARLLGAAQASPTSAPAYGAQARRLDAAAAEARSRLGSEFDAEVAAGRRLGDQAAVALALQATHPNAASTEPPVLT